MIDKAQFISLAGKLVNGLLREALGFTVEYQIPYYHGIVGYMVEAPMLWIRPSRFPIFFIAYDYRHPDLLSDVVTQLEIAKATEYFALLIVVPVREGTGNEAEELRHLVADSVYRYDFIVLDRFHLAGIIAHNNSQKLIEIILQQGIELPRLSPYVTKGPVPENMFFGRESQLKTISQTIENSDYAVVGGRRIGKSSTLLRLTRLLNNDPRRFAIYLNCEEKFNYNDFFGVLGDEYKIALDTADPLSIRRLVAALKEAHRSQLIVFLLDEVDELLAFDAGGRAQLFKAFRTLSHEGAARFVFSGSRTLYRHLHDPKSPFFNYCQDIILGPLAERAVAEIISKPMRQLGVELPQEKELIARVIEYTSCHPSLVQWLCDKLLRTIAARRITLENLQAILETPEFGRYFIETAWGDASPLEKIVSLVLDRSAFEINDLVAAAARYGLDNKRMIQEALETLKLFALVEQRGKQHHFLLSQFPRIVRAVEDVPFLIESLLTQMEE